MSVNAWMNCNVYALENEDAVREWCESVAVGFWGSRTWFPEGYASIGYETGWFTDAVDCLREQLASIKAPTGSWWAECRYECMEYANEDGSIITFDVVDGKAVNWKESEIVMVEREPMANFEPIGGTK